MKYKIVLEEFEGPLDLLLHLIKKDDISIFDISIEKITQQYLEYINLIQEKNLDISSEYLVMAATLIEMKAKMLLPNKTEEEEEEIEEEKNNLIEKLIEYEKYKQMTSTFKSLEEIRRQVHTRNSEEILNYRNDEDIDYGINLDDLVLAFQNFLEKKEFKKPLNTKIEKKEYSINKRCSEIKNLLSKKKKINFNDLFDRYTKDYIVVTFLAVLSMAKRSEIILEQTDNFDNISIKAKEK